MTSKRIVKVQLSIHTNQPVRQVLIYDERKAWAFQGDATPEIVEAMGGDLKRYFKASRSRAGKLHLFERVRAQSW